MPHRLLLPVLGGSIAAALVLASPAAACSGGEVTPTAANLAAVRTTLVCLQNQVRGNHRLPLLKRNTALRRAAVANSAKMVAQGYFAHTDPAGTTFMDRMITARYAVRNRDWTLGENLAWATGSQAAPATVMRDWMASPGHRANILRRSYRDVGVGIATGVPSDRSAGATFTVDFGVRR